VTEESLKNQELKDLLGNFNPRSSMMSRDRKGTFFFFFLVSVVLNELNFPLCRVEGEKRIGIVAQSCAIVSTTSHVDSARKAH
jgi:hypothetical protein